MNQASPEPSTANNHNIHRLCQMCKSIKFNLHFTHQCQQQTCPIRLWYSPLLSEPMNVHSNVFAHHAGLASLESSAEDGCHLCTLLFSSLSRCKFESNDQFIVDFSSAQVSLVHGTNMSGKCELLRVMCSGQSAELDIVDIPWTITVTKDLAPIFVAITHTARQYPPGDEPAPLLNYPSLEYKPGDEFEVLHVWRRPKPLWLARHCTDTERPIGWIKPRHHTKFTNHPILNVPRLRPVWEECRIARREKAYLEMRSDSERIFSQIRLWDQGCEAHKSCLHRPEKLPLRVIDVGIAEGNRSPFLLETHGQKGHYLALSYRWGTRGTLRTTTGNLSAHKKAIPLAHMPQTMQDAITVARRLGWRYIWIDALCILQDSKSDWEIHAAQMHKIFANAWLVISADAAKDSESGFLKPRNALELASCQHPSLFEDSAGLPNKVICPRIPHAQNAVNHSELSTRGWVLQERLLARRIIHWGKYEVYWECKELDASERQPVKSLPPTEAEPSASADFRELRKAVQPHVPLSSYGPRGAKVGKTIASIKHIISRTNSECWYRIVEEYSKRTLTQPLDRLPAVSGLASAIRSHSKPRAKYVAGLWAEDLPHALLWRRASAVGLHSPKSPTESTTSFIAPSFSWAACPAPVIFSPFCSKTVKCCTRVLASSTTPRGNDEFGELVSGWIKLRGLTIPLDTLHAQCPAASKPSIPGSGLFMDTPDDCLDLCGRDITVLSVRNGRRSVGTGDSGPFGHHACLLLVPTADAGVYRRVGYYEPEPFLYRAGARKWEIQTLTVI